MTDSPFLISLVGVAGTLAGGGLTGLLSARSERRKEVAAERQQIREEQAGDRSQLRELRLEHLKWRRERRQAAYLTFYEQVQIAEDLFTDTTVQIRTKEPDLQKTGELLGSLRKNHALLGETLAAVRLEGPANVAVQASELVTVISETATVGLKALKPRDAGEVAEFERTLDERIDVLARADIDFLNLARAALDEITRLD